MATSAPLRCRCTAVLGRVAAASPKSSNRLLCYCDDCQAFLHHLGRADLLDAHGGVDIIQVAPASLTFDRGADRIAGLRLSPKGLYRWYASCCNTPLGNTLGPALPFVGIVAQAFERPDDVFGEPVAAIHGKYAVGPAPEGSTKLDARFVLRTLRRLAGWRFGGGAWPHPYFDRRTRAPNHRVRVLSPAEREALRPLCGPRRAS